MKNRPALKNIDSLVCITISIIGILSTFYLWIFVSHGNHWGLFGSEFEKFLIKYNEQIIYLFSFPLLIPLIKKRNRNRLIIALSTIPVYLFLFISIKTFLD